MADTIKIKYSDTPSSAPSSLSVSEIAINRADKKLFYNDSSNVIQSINLFVMALKTISTDVTRQAADTTTYAINDALSDSTSAPTSGGFTFTSAGRISGGSGIITDAIFTSSANPALLLSAELWIFNQAVTAINDNVSFTISDSEVKTVVGVIPFTLFSAGPNSLYHAQNLSIGYTCVGTANLRFLYKVKNAYIPVGSEVITATIKVIQID